MLGVVIIILFVGACVIVPSIGADICKVSVNQSSYTQHDPIYIHGNEEFTSENGVTGGSGTSNDPYIIENITMDATSSPSGSGITIQNSASVYFIIRNCYITNAPGANFDYAGIKLLNTNNGKIINNYCSYNEGGGIYLSIWSRGRHDHSWGGEYISGRGGR